MSKKKAFMQFIKTDKARIVLLFLIIAVETIIFSRSGYFLSFDNLMTALVAYIEIGIIALGMTFVLMSGGIDLSVGSLLALVSITIGFTYRAGCPFVLSILLGVIVGVLGGTFNGVLIVYGELHPFVVTLGTYSLYRGLAYGITNAEGFSEFPKWFRFFGNTSVGGVVPVQFLIYVVIAFLMWILFRKKPFGTKISGIGYNSTASRFSGVKVNKEKLKVYVLNGLLVAIAAIIYTSRTNTSRGNAGENMEMYAITAVVLGGTYITGGHGTMFGTVLGTIILAFLKNGFAMLGITNDLALFATGLIILASMIFNRLLGKDKR